MNGSNVMQDTLLADCRKGDKGAFFALADAYRNIIENSAFRIVKDRDAVKDVMQEVLIRIYKGIGAFNGKSRLSTWIYRITLNESIRYVTKYRKNIFETDAILDGFPDGSDEILGEMIEEERKKVIRAHVESLPPDFRAVLVMFYFGSMKAEDIAAALNVPLGTVNSRIARARGMLREKLEEDGGDA
jgi:RNA polymerase sigma factor (sigma-70 family)